MTATKTKAKNGPKKGSQPASKASIEKARREIAASQKAADAAAAENAKKRKQRTESSDGMAPSERAIQIDPTEAPSQPKAKAKPRVAVDRRHPDVTDRAIAEADGPGPKRMSMLDAAATVLASAKEPMRTKDMIEAMSSRGLWTSPGGKTPQSTLYAAMAKEIAAKKAGSRFAKVERGMFAINGAGS